MPNFFTYENWNDPKTLEELEEYASYTDFDLSFEGNDLKFSRYGETVITLPDYKKNAVLMFFANDTADGTEGAFTIRTLSCLIDVCNGHLKISGTGLNIDFTLPEERKDEE